VTRTRRRGAQGASSGRREGDDLGGPTGREERRVLLIGLLMALNLFFCLVLFDPKLHTGGDSSEYVSLASSVLRTGDGYADSAAPGDPVPHTKYPPGYPLMLAPLLALFGPNFVILKLLSVALTVSSVLVFSLWVTERVGPARWLAVSLAFAVNPAVVDYSRWILSEAPFLFVTLLALLFLQREAGEKAIGKYFWLSILAIVAAYYVRSVGIVLIAAGTFYYLLTRQWRKSVYYNAVAAALSLPWFVRNQLLEGSATPYIEQFLLRSVYEPEAGYHDLWGMIGRFFTNLWIYSAREMPRVLVGSDSLWSAHVAVRGLGVVVCVLALAGLVHTARKRVGVAEIYFALSCLAILLFEEVVSDVRYLVPLVPLVLVYAADGVTLVTEKGDALGDPSRVTSAAMIVFAAIGVFSQLARAPRNIEMIRQYGRGDALAGYHPNWRSFFLAADWVSANTPADAVVTVRKPRLFHLRTGRKVVLYPYSTDPDSVLDVVLDTDYVVVDQISATTARYLMPGIQAAPERFAVVFESPGTPTWVLRVLEPGER
jgi:4-amino-4-deoxy-L-arabinose transferase-like glycosyltransferase